MNTQISHILVVEDEQHIRHFIRTALENESYQVTEAGTYHSALQAIQNQRLDMIILDLGLPDGDGLELIKHLRTWSKLPVLVLSARVSDQDKIKALDAGADDYLSKPFSTGELLARVRALLRRSQFNPSVESPLIRFGEVEVDLLQRKVNRKGQAVRLTPIEFHLLSLLLLNAGRVMTHRHLLREVWGSTYVESNHYLRVYVGHLRQKLEDDPSQPRHFLTETGIDYRFQL
ncbi:MAG: response regulator [Thiothrix sp.]|uniref:response regulator n=1 Tax=Thiothrix sp. TaxID=1032 RepID=UPI0026277F2C|nr:response regulator [Thiothrix sp.]MDD5394126.1 response regulator [Thiothrix sp.]